MLPWGGYGVGARYVMPLRIPALLRSGSIKDSWALEFGADYLRIHDDYGLADLGYSEILPVGGIMWNLWFNPHFAIYPKIEAGYAFAWFDSNYGPGVVGYGYGGTFLSGAGGLLYKLDSGITFRAEAGSSGLKAGVGWLLFFQVAALPRFAREPLVAPGLRRGVRLESG